jgi:hypothetical protein
MSETVRLVFAPPGPDTPGYLRRAHRALKFSARLTGGNPSPETVEEMVEFLTEFVVEPSDPDEKREALWMATENEFKTLLASVAGSAGGDSPSP